MKVIRQLGLAEYQPTFDAMRKFTRERGAGTPDEIWLLEHPPVYTLGQAGRPEHLLRRSAIPLVRTDRGGQITYHGPGQIVAYTLIDLRRLELNVRELVAQLEQAVIDLLSDYGIDSARRAGAPGVYVRGAKVAALGLRVRHGCCYHGIALNVDMDLTPFADINPCGHEGLEVTQLRDLGVGTRKDTVAQTLGQRLFAGISHSGKLH